MKSTLAILTLTFSGACLNAAVRDVYPELSAIPTVSKVAAASVALLRDGRDLNSAFCGGIALNEGGSEYLLTAFHCISNQKECEQTSVVQNFDKSQSREMIFRQCGRLIYGNPYYDIAVFAVAKNDKDVPFTTLPLSALESTPGQKYSSIFTIGHPARARKTMASGCSSLGSDSAKIIHNCGLEPGFSGGPLADLETGAIIGINSAGESWDALGIQRDKSADIALLRPIIINSILGKAYDETIQDSATTLLIAEKGLKIDATDYHIGELLDNGENEGAANAAVSELMRRVAKVIVSRVRVKAAVQNGDELQYKIIKLLRRQGRKVNDRLYRNTFDPSMSDDEIELAVQLQM
jgi:hypothetical protein